MRNRVLMAALALTLATGTACIQTGPSAEVDVSDCAGDADVDDTIRVVHDTEESLHEMVICGQITSELATAMSQAVTSLVGNPAKAPDQVEYVGEGIYEVSTPRVDMDLWVQDGGDVVQGNLLDPADFFTNLRVDTEGLNVVLRFDDAGPLAFLLGAGKNPSSPLRLDPLELDDATARVGKLKLVGALTLDDDRENGTIVGYDLEIPAMKLAALAGLEPMEYAITGLQGSRDDLGQRIETISWDVAYTDHSLDGTIEVAFLDGPFDVLAEYVYVDGEPHPDIAVSCYEGETLLFGG